MRPHAQQRRLELAIIRNNTTHFFFPSLLCFKKQDSTHMQIAAVCKWKARNNDAVLFRKQNCVLELIMNCRRYLNKHICFSVRPELLNAWPCSQKQHGQVSNPYDFTDIKRDFFPSFQSSGTAGGFHWVPLHPCPSNFWGEEETSLKSGSRWVLLLLNGRILTLGLLTKAPRIEDCSDTPALI